MLYIEDRGRERQRGLEKRTEASGMDECFPRPRYSLLYTTFIVPLTCIYILLRFLFIYINTSHTEMLFKSLFKSLFLYLSLFFFFVFLSFLSFHIFILSLFACTSKEKCIHISIYMIINRSISHLQCVLCIIMFIYIYMVIITSSYM